MKNIYLLLLVALFLSNCKDDNLKEFNAYATDPKIETTKPVNDFVWHAMNFWYIYQDAVPNLSDEKKKNKAVVPDLSVEKKKEKRKEFISYINSFESPEKLFSTLLYNEGVDDRFSIIVDDYDTHADKLSGKYVSFGFRSEKILVSNGIKIMAIKKISKNSLADVAKLKRGDFIIGINGEKFSDGDYDQIIKDAYKKTQARFMIGEKDGKTVIKEVSLEKIEVDDHAIQYSNIYKAGTKSVGYLVYNGFWTKNNKELNEVFAKFKNSPNKITDLILDLRYNGGGSIDASSYLGSLIYGEGSTTDVFANLAYNTKINRVIPYKFKNEITEKDKSKIQLNRLTGINTLYVLTSNNTAFSSELIINCLRSYMNVKVVGTTTRGENFASRTLYDSRTSRFRQKPTGKDHKYAIQLLTGKLYNSQMISDYPLGFTPDIVIDEFKYLDGLKPFGDENETLLKTTLNHIKGLSPRAVFDKGPEIIEHEALEENPFGNQAYLTDEVL